MNRRPSGSLLLSKAITGFLQYKAAEGLSPTTLRSYEHDLKLWLEYTGDKPINWIKTPAVRDYFVWLRRSSLSKVVEIHVPTNAWWKTRSQSALEVVAQVAQNSAQDELTRTLAKSILAKDEFLLRLWQLGDEYTPVVYDLLLTLDKRLFLIHAPLSTQEWKILG